MDLNCTGKMARSFLVILGNLSTHILVVTNMATTSHCSFCIRPLQIFMPPLYNNGFVICYILNVEILVNLSWIFCILEKMYTEKNVTGYLQVFINCS